MSQVFGTVGNDVLHGANKVDDYINGGPGDDVLSGGRGIDHFAMSLNGGGHDIVTDFEPAKPNSGYVHDYVVFDGWGNFVDAVWGSQLSPAPLYDGETLWTTTGHVLTVLDTGTDVVLSWDTGDTLTLQNIEPGQIQGNYIASIGSYDYIWS